MLRSPEWASWCAAEHRCLWIHGIPGAGKTILMSHLIEHIARSCDQAAQQNSTYAYYYCLYARHQDEDTPFLKWLINRLCREADCVPLYLFEMSKHGADPNGAWLLEALALVLMLFDTVYVAIDAIDESSNRQNLLESIYVLATDERFTRIRLLTSSRDYIDIEKTMLRCAVSCPMDNPYVVQDLRICVHRALQSNPRFAKWPENLLQRVEEEISITAKGM